LREVDSMKSRGVTMMTPPMNRSVQVIMLPGLTRDMGREDL
jgi:hypothetical protein